jgi:hypothetical protein
MPYYVKRSAEGNLPVYYERKRRVDRTYEYVTKIGGLYGDMDRFAIDASHAIGPSHLKFSRRKACISGSANLVDKVKQWLQKCGF